MTTNVIPTRNEVTALAIAVLENKVEFLPHITRGYDEAFNGPVKIGSNIQIRVPSFFYADNAGAGFTQQGADQTTVTLVANSQPKVAIGLTDQELSLEVNSMLDLYIEPAAATLASYVDQQLLSMITGYSYGSATGIINPSYIGSYGGFYNIVTPGGITNGAPVAWTGVDFNSAATSAATATKPFNVARQRLIEESVPSRDYVCVLSPGAMANTVPQMTTLFNPAKNISDIFEFGEVREYGGAAFVETPNVPTFTAGTWAASGVEVNTTSNTGDSSIVLKDLGASAVINQGDQFTIAGVYAVNRLSGQAYPWLRVFVATSQVTASGGGVATVNVAPQVILAGSNVAGPTVSALPTANAAVTFVGTPNTSTQAGLYFWKGAVAAAFPMLPQKLAGAEVGVANDKDNKITLRWVTQYQASAGQEFSRLETLFGGAVLRQGLGIRLQA